MQSYFQKCHRGRAGAIDATRRELLRIFANTMRAVGDRGANTCERVRILREYRTNTARILANSPRIVVSANTSRIV